ncbi:expressed unknown protein [Seminavis robusta]|uniref:Uncharacterized protein n=1 Tax=Seminavis robusta TaxID=568900 RepID=A0A9N8HL21_9STRA|nr:expressed unknown protein [Seminavis robusta]|eukprot:Sro653_g181940.1 n/a (677) ;mRNA; r:24932-26962
MATTIIRSSPGHSISTNDDISGFLWGLGLSTTATVAVGSFLAAASTKGTTSEGTKESLWSSLKVSAAHFWRDIFILPLKCWVLRHWFFPHNKHVILLPADKTAKTLAAASSSTTTIRSEQHFEHWTLLIIFPGHGCPPEHYIPIAQVLQEQARRSHLKLVVGIVAGNERLQKKSSWWSWSIFRWALDHGNPTVLANWIQLLAEEAVLSGKSSTDENPSSSLSTAALRHIYNPHLRPQIFQDLFVWGHSSLGGQHAIRAAYSSKFRGLLLYGCSLATCCPQTGRQRRPESIQNALLASYPRPVLTMVGARDGHFRCLRVASEAQVLQRDIQRQSDNFGSGNNINNQDTLKRQARLRKPIVVLSELNHGQMANGRWPSLTAAKKPSDFSSRESLATAHARIAQVALDFVQTHSTCPLASQRVVEAQNRLLHLGKSTHTMYLSPWLRLSARDYACRFVAQIQQELLHVTAGDADSKFYLYEEEDADESSVEQDVRAPEILPQWHVQHEDFLYSKPHWDAEANQLVMNVVEQDPVGISVPPQLAKTLAFKGRSQDEILFNQNVYREIKDSQQPTLMQLNQQTFNRILNAVTLAQKRRYLAEGKQLRFGPDILVWPPPLWVTQPISITKMNDSGGTHYYLWQSTYTSTPVSSPAPFGGAWYGKPLSPTQAYEWIVFDAFKP